MEGKGELVFLVYSNAKTFYCIKVFLHVNLGNRIIADSESNHYFYIGWGFE
jgi:hypothetical protein